MMTYNDVDEINSLEPERVVFYSGMGDYDKGLITSAANKLSSNIIKGWWLGDLRDPDKHLHIHKLSSIDHLFVPSKNWFERYSSYGPKVTYLPQSGYAYCTDTFKYNNWKEYDAIFIGAFDPVAPHCWHDNRLPILKQFSRCCSTGTVTNQSTTHAQTYLYKHVPISISITWPGAVCYSSNRLYNIIAAGGLAFQNYIPQLDDVFRDREHLVYFKSEEEIPDLVSHYLKSPEEVLSIKKAAKKLFEEKHTGDERVKNMIDIMSGATSDYYGYL